MTTRICSYVSSGFTKKKKDRERCQNVMCQYMSCYLPCRSRNQQKRSSTLSPTLKLTIQTRKRKAYRVYKQFGHRFQVSCCCNILPERLTPTLVQLSIHFCPEDSPTSTLKQIFSCKTPQRSNFLATTVSLSRSYEHAIT